MANHILAITPQDVRGFANLPSEVPDALINKHIDVAARELRARTGMDEPPDGHEADWNEALTLRALASVFPWLHTFSLSGAAKVGRLEGSVEYRFLDADDTAAAVEKLTSRYDVLAARIKSAGPKEEDDSSAGFGALGMIAV
jgi:hypothetical protein